MVGTFKFGKARLYRADCLDWLAGRKTHTVHAVVTDPPYGLREYTMQEQEKRRNGNGGVWRIPPAYLGANRAALPRFSTLTRKHLAELDDFFLRWGEALVRVLVPGAHVVVASNPLVSFVVSNALDGAGFERRGEIVRLVQTMRGGDRPKGAHEKFDYVSVMPRAMWEPWLLFRKPLEGRVQDNLERWWTGGLRRPSEERPFGDVIRSRPATPPERALAPHPSLKPQAFLRQVVQAVLPLGRGTVLDPFAGAGSTLAAAQAVGLRSVGVELLPEFYAMAKRSIPLLAAYSPNGVAHGRS